MDATVGELGEFGLIDAITARLTTSPLVLIGPGDDAAGQPLRQVIVRVAEQAQRDAGRQERPERLAGRTREGQVDGALGQPGGAEATGEQRSQHRADGAVDVADGEL